MTYDAKLTRRLLAAGVALNLEMPRGPAQVFVHLLTEAAGTGNLTVSTSLRRMAAALPGGLTSTINGVVWLTRKGYLKGREEGKARRPHGSWTLDLDAMERDAILIRRRLPAFSKLLEDAGVVDPLPEMSVRKRTRPPVMAAE